jgi:23S rRNA (uracil1939-C5)-methyltransferase
MSKSRIKLPQELIVADIESLSHEGRGIAQVNGKTTFIDGTLPGETVRFRYRRQRSRFDEGFIESVLKVAPDRVDPKCDRYRREKKSARAGKT